MTSVEHELIIKEYKVSFYSTINPEQRGVLERVIFFNNNQTEYYFDIEHLIKSYGQPRIVEENDRVYLNFEKIDCQNIFIIIDHNLVGLAIYYRDSLDNIDLVHIAVDEKYSSTGKYADKLLVLQMINKLKKIALKLKGIKTITVKYGQKRVIHLKKV